MQVTNGNIKMEELIYHLQIHFNFILKLNLKENTYIFLKATYKYNFNSNSVVSAKSGFGCHPQF